MNKVFSKLTLFVVILLAVFTLAACGNDKTPTKASVTLTASATNITYGETVKLTIEVKNATNTNVAWSISNPELLTLDYQNNVTVLKETKQDEKVTITATLVEDTTVSASVTIDVYGTEHGKGNDPITPVDLPVITIIAPASTIKKGESVSLTVMVDNAKDPSYTWSYSIADVLSIDANNVVTVTGDIVVDKVVTVTATLNENTTVTASKTFTVFAPVIEGQVGELTSDMLKALGNPNVTVTGVVTDYYTDFNQSFNSTQNKYDLIVKMDTDKWYGKWNIQGKTQNVIEDNYRKGNVDGLRDQYGNKGHGLEKVYIDKNNQVAYKLIKDYMSIPAVWEAQHLWNHLGNLQISKFVYDPVNEVYSYEIDEKNEDDLYLMTYLAYSLTPMLEDTFLKLYITIEDGKITKLTCQTEILYYGSDTREDATAMSYTEAELVLSDFGTTVVADPAPFTEPSNSALLKTALENMAAQNNYTFRLVDTTTYAPAGDEGDYVLEARHKVRDNVSATGTVGTYGQITADAILVAETGKYTASMDGKDYHTSYTGYKQNNDGSYDEFSYSSSVDAFVGTKKVNGNISSLLPTFDFSTALFKYIGQTEYQNELVYNFQLKDASITRDIALEMTMKKYAKDGSTSTTQTLTITVDGNGNLISVVYPYSISGGVYAGFYNIYYTNVGTTAIAEDTFEGYVPRVIKATWDQYTVKYFSANFTTRDSHEESAETVFPFCYGDAAQYLPSPIAIYNIFGDNYYGPFYDWKEVAKDAEGTPIYHGWVSLTAQSQDYDENMQLNNFDEIYEKIKTELEACGYVLSVANTDTSGGESGRSNRIITFVNDYFTIVIENNFTSYFWIDFYITGDWTLNR